jgi:hypothetical protein
MASIPPIFYYKDKFFVISTSLSNGVKLKLSDFGWTYRNNSTELMGFWVTKEEEVAKKTAKKFKQKIINQKTNKILYQ